jgi:MFS family permease
MHKCERESSSEPVMGINRNVFFVGVTSFFVDVSVKMIYSVMPLFLLSIGASKTSLSLIEGIAESTASLLKALSGIWSDKIGRNKPFMLIGYSITALVTPVYALVTYPIQVLGLRFIERVGKGLRTAPRDSLISNSVADGETGKNFGFHKAMDNSGAIVGPLLAFLLLWQFPANYGNIFLWATIPAILGVLSIIFFIREAHGNPAKEKPNFSFKLLPKRFYFFLVIICIFSLGNSTDALLLVKTSETGINSSYIPFVYMIFNVVSVSLAIPLGKLSDKIGRAKLIIPGFLIYAIVYLGFGFFNHLGAFTLLFILYGVYSALTDSCLKSLVSDLTGKDLKGTAFGIYHAALGGTLLPASLIAGVLYDKVNSSAPFYFGASMALIACAMMFVFVFYQKKTARD